MKRMPNKGYKDDTDDDEEPYTLRQFIKELVASLVIIAIVLSAIYVYTENWPPVVVVVSSSMQHGLGDSTIGTIDIGDIVFVKKVHSRSDIVTWVEGREKGYETYGNYGDVIVYRKDGGNDVPVIHRAIVWVEVNKESLTRFMEQSGYVDYSMITFDVPSLGLENVRSFVIKDFISYNRTPSRHVYDLHIDLGEMVDRTFKAKRTLPHSGFITKGDNNLFLDQMSLPAQNGGNVDPVKVDWVVGAAVGEIPWIGLIKMSVSGEIDPGDPPAQNSWFMLVFVVVLIVTLPIVVEVVIKASAYAWNRYRERKGNGERGDTKGMQEKRPPERHGP